MHVFKTAMWSSSQVCIHKILHTYVNTCMHAYIHTYMHAYIHTHMHTHTHMYIYIYQDDQWISGMYTHICIHSYKLVGPSPDNTFKSRKIHTYIHKHIHTTGILASKNVLIIVVPFPEPLLIHSKPGKIHTYTHIQQVCSRPKTCGS